MRYVHVGTKSELEDALFVPSVEEMDCIVEVESSINANAIVHRLFWAFVLFLGFTCPHFWSTLLTLNTRPQHFGEVCTPSRRKFPGHCFCQFFSSSDDQKCTSLPSLWNTIFAVQVRIRQRLYLNITVFFSFCLIKTLFAESNCVTDLPYVLMNSLNSIEKGSYSP